MKKSIIFIVTILLLINASGCKSNKESKKDESKKFEMKKSETLVDSYMKALITEDSEGIKKILTDQLNKSLSNTPKSALKVKGYSKDESYQVGETGIFKVKVASTSLDSSRTSVDTYIIKVALENWNYKISDIKATSDKESYAENNSLRVRNKNNVKSELLIDSDGIPQYGFSKEDKAQITKIELPRNNFGNINFSYSGDSIAISTVGNVTFISTVKISSESVPTAGAQGQGGEAGGQPGTGQDQNKGAREIPVGKEISALDVLKNAKVDFMVFSSDEKLLLVQYTGINGMKCLRVYSTEKGDLIPFKFEENYNTNNVEIVYSYFDKDTLYYQVIPKNDKNNTQKSVAGMWQMDLKKFKVKKV